MLLANCRLNLLFRIVRLIFHVVTQSSYLIQNILVDNIFILRCWNTNWWRYLTDLIIPYGFTWHLARLLYNLNCPLCTPFFVWRRTCRMLYRYVCVLDLVHIMVYCLLICGTFKGAVLLGVMSLIEDPTVCVPMVV